MLQSVKVQSHVGEDGILRLELPLDVINTDVELLIVFQPILSEHRSADALGWPPDYFEETFGSFKDEPLERPPQGEFEIRTELK
jgi:hypothetical protein